ncbi:MAG: transposase [Thiomargarita sp.]|nr:transposase [Thiomargarita sp.]
MITIELILTRMSKICQPQRKFVMNLLTTLMCLRGKANFRNISRYGDLNEKTYSRGFRKDFDFVTFNKLSLEKIIESNNTLIAAIDCSFIPKSGQKTYGLDKFFNGKQGKAEKGLEISTLAMIDVPYNTAYNLSTRQTPVSIKKDETRVDRYLAQIQEVRDALPKKIRYLVTDGYYSKTKFINGIADLELKQIGKLRHDANLRWIYKGEQKLLGRPKRYDGKVNFEDLSGFKLENEIDGTKCYTAIVNSPKFKRDLRIVFLVKVLAKKVCTALLFSTDLELAAKDLCRFYKARFQIEFLFRDAKQFTGLSDCQARCRQSLNFHFNASMTALNLIKLEDRQQDSGTKRHVISIASWKIRKANKHLLERFSSILGLDWNVIKSNPKFETLCNYGAVLPSILP